MARVIVIGGGIGGLTTAIAFSRKDWDVSVHEATPELRPVGAGIWVPINAMQVLGKFGLAKEVSGAGWPIRSIELRTVSGKLLSNLTLTDLAARYGHCMISIHRADLVEALANALPDGVLRFGSQFTHFVQDSSGVVAHFADGSEQAAELLVGADGIHSRVREQMFPQMRLRYSGQTCFRGIAEIALPDGLASTCREVWGGRNRFGFSAVGPGHVYWFAPRLSPPGVKDPLDFRMQSLRDVYREFPSPIPEILDATKVEDTVRTDLFDLRPISQWSRGNVVLVGDAAHAMTPNLGQGGAQAIEDAFVLAEQFQQPGSVTRALENYEGIRIPKVKRIVKTSWTFGKMAHWQNPVARWARDAAIRWTPRSVEQKQLDRLYNIG